MGKWGKWALLLVLAMVFAVPAWAVDLKLGGKYEIQGRYYSYQAIRSVDNDAQETNPVTTMYLKHYFNLYPTLTVNDKIKIIGDLEVFDNRISKSDSYQYYDKSSSAASNTGDSIENVDYYSLFTVNELYVDALTDFGKFIVGKNKLFNGIGWFIQVPQAEGWTFGLVWNKLNENANPNSYFGYTSVRGGDGADELGVVCNHDNADEDDFALIANYAKDALDFRSQLQYKHAGHSNAQTSIFLPIVYVDYAINKDLKFNSKFGYGTGTLLAKGSNVAQALVAATGMTAVYTDGIEEDFEVDNGYLAWVGIGATLNDLKVKADIAYLSGADQPNKTSAYLDDSENLDAWLMNDIADRYSVYLQTPATITGLLPGGKRDFTATGRGSQWDGNFSFANAMLARLNLSYQFSKKLDGNLNLLWGQMTNTDYLKNYTSLAQVATGPAAIRASGLYTAQYMLGMIDPEHYTVGGTGNAALIAGMGIVPPTGSTNPANQGAEYDVDAAMGWEARARINYALQDNLSLGLDLCYYAPGDLYKKMIENAFIDGYDTGSKMENTYAARWRATVKF